MQQLIKMKARAAQQAISIIELESHLGLCEVQEGVDLSLIDVSTSIGIGLRHRPAALPPTAQPPAAGASYSMPELLLADPPVLVHVELHQPPPELLHRHLPSLPAADRQTPSSVPVARDRHLILLDATNDFCAAYLSSSGFRVGKSMDCRTRYAAAAMDHPGLREPPLWTYVGIDSFYFYGVVIKSG